MIQNQSDKETEHKISTLFENIHFEKQANKKIFSRWKSNSLQVIDSTIFYQINGFVSSARLNRPTNSLPSNQDQIQHRQNSLRQRRELAAQLEEINQVLQKDGEEAAEKLLRKYSQTLPAVIKWVSLSILLVLLLLVARAIS